MIKKERDMDLVSKEYAFVNDATLRRFDLAKNPWVTECYLYLIDEKIASFLVMMDEKLTFGFLHYHVPDEHKDYFIKQYPSINKKTNQIIYVYTSDDFRRTGLATKVIDFMCNDMQESGFRYIWLKKETKSAIYEKLGFQHFQKVISEIIADPEDFFTQYEQVTGLNRDSLISKYGDKRLVKVLR